MLAQTVTQPVEHEINHRCRIERQDLAHDQAPHDCVTERLPKLRTRPLPSMSGRYRQG